MSNTEYLDVDAIEPKVQKVIKIKGEEHEFKPPSVGEFIAEMQRIKDFQAQMKKAEAKGEAPDQAEVMTEIVTKMRDSVRQSFPTVPEDVVAGMTFEQLQAIRAFIEARLDDEVAEADEGNG